MEILFRRKSLKAKKGGSANLQEKEVEITENGTETITADSGYDGLSSVAVTTDVPSGDAVFDFSHYNTSVSTSSGNGYTGISKITDLDCANITSLWRFMQLASSLKEVSLKNTSNITQWGYAFNGCERLTKISGFDTSKAKKIHYLFSGCLSLANVPVFDLSSIDNPTDITGTMKNAFGYCQSLTNASLQNILKSMLTLNPNYTGTRTLQYIGLTSAQATTCTSFDEWAELQTKGWTTGY